MKGDALIAQLIRLQFPQWAHLPLLHIPSIGTDNFIYRLGTDKCVRFPKTFDAATLIAKEQYWLPYLAPFLPISIPIPLGKGTPSTLFSWPWGIYGWLDGMDAFVAPTPDLPQFAVDIAQFLKSLHAIDLIGGPSSRRGGPLILQDHVTRGAITSLQNIFDVDRLIILWEDALRTPIWNMPPVWTHGDLLPANILIKEGRLGAVLDFGLMGCGDPACDFMVSWSLLDPRSRDIFRTAMGCENSLWKRGQGWALSTACSIISFYGIQNPGSNPGLVSVAERMLYQLLIPITR